MRDLNANLNARVAERTAALERANSDLREEMAQSARLQEQMHRSHRLESIGTLAGGVAHDFNNLLTVIGGYSAMMMDREGLSPEDRTTLEEIHRAGQRAAGLTRQLLTFSRQQVVEPRLLNLNAILTDTERMLRRVIGEDLLLMLSLDPEIGAIFADAGQIEQIVMNLAVNARDAMPDGGELHISTANVEVPATSADPPPGRYARLRVVDNGCGMSEDIKCRIFDPFFTTKPVGQGTGLGLATVFGIVSQSRGRIQVDSAPGMGTTFTMLFPVAADTAPHQSTEPARPRRGSGTVLIVEDDDGVRALSSKALRLHGYRVLESSGGEDAMRICRDYPEEIHLLITDVIMPGMGGRKVADGVVGLRPGTPVLYVSGYTNDAVVRHGVEHDHVAFLQKPFSPSALIRKVQDVLGGAPGASATGAAAPGGS